MNPMIFREYDIRGLAESELTDEVVLKLGKAIGTYIIEDRTTARVALGRDVRLSSPRIHESLVQGLTSTGCTVVDCGVVPTPVLYFASYTLQTNGAVMVTGSHNPCEYNGFKITRDGLSLYGRKIQEIREIIEREAYVQNEGSVEKFEALAPYGDCLIEKIDLSRGLKVVIDAGNGTAGMVAPSFMERLGCEVVPLYCEPDGHFPNHLPDPTIPAYVEDLKKTVLEQNADLGIGYDGDADRIGVIDDKGGIIWGDRLLGIFASDVLARRPGAPIIFEVKCSQGLTEYIERLGGQPVMWKTGHSLIKARMKELDSPLAGEMSGHMFFADDYFGYDDAIYASGRLLQILSRTDRPLSDLAGEIPQYRVTPEIRIDCRDEDKFRVVAQLQDRFRKTHEVIDVDGVRVQFPDGWGLVRASNTQPVLVLRFEAKTEESLREIIAELTGEIRRFPSVDSAQLERIMTTDF